MTKRKITFERGGLTLVGNVYVPANFDENGSYRAVIVEGSFTSVKEQMAGTYAEKLAQQDFVALAFDYSHYGESGGTPRQVELLEEKLSDLKAAVSYLSTLPYVNSVRMVGVCTSAGNAAFLAAHDDRIKGLATVAAFLPNPALFKMMFGDEVIAKRRADGTAAKLKFEQTGEETIIPAYSETDKGAVNFGQAGSFDNYLSKNRGNVPQYKNEFNTASWNEWLDFDPVAQATSIAIPTIVVHSDESAFPDQAKQFYSLIKGEKELVWANGNHYDYYDSPAQIDNAVKNVVRFFDMH